MRRALLIPFIAMLVIPFAYLQYPSMEASEESAPFIPHEVKVLVVSPLNPFVNGGHYLISDLARYGFNVTQHTSDDSNVDYRSDPKTSDLSQYDVVILHGGYIGYPPTKVSVEEVNYFTNYGGVLIVIGNALLANETSSTWPYFWDDNFASAPVQKLEQRLGVTFTTRLYPKNGTFTLEDPLFKGPQNLSYITTAPPVTTTFQFELILQSDTRETYSFTQADANGKTISGVTYYRNSTGATGIYIQGSYIHAVQETPSPYGIRYFGFTNISERPRLLASLIAHALSRDIDTVIKPQPLASIRLDRLGGQGYSEDYLNASLSNFNSVVDEHGIIPTISFTDYLDPYYWRTHPHILPQLRTTYRDWEYSSSLRYPTDASSMTQSELEGLIQKIEGNYTAFKMDLFSTIATRAGFWNQTTLDAMVNEDLYLLDMSGEPYSLYRDSLEKYYSDWWSVRVISSVIVHCSAKMGWYGEAEYFTDMTDALGDPNVAKKILHYEYFRDRDKWAFAAVNGFPSFVYGVWSFPRNEVGTYSLKTLYSNLTAEIPDIRFVPLVEAALFFGNKWMKITNQWRSGSTIEFDVDSSAVPDVANIGKGMFWLRIDTNKTVQQVLINDEPWFYFDDHTIRLPARSAHVKVTLGERTNPVILRTVRNVNGTQWNGERFVVSLTATSGLNVSIWLFIPLLDAACSETQWGYKFDAYKRVLELWAISDVDGVIVFQVGADVSLPIVWSIKHSSAWYNVSVTITANITDLQSGVKNATLSYSVGSEWINVTMTSEGGLYTGLIPSFSYGTIVRYRLNATDKAGNWNATEISKYEVGDKTPPEMGTPQWSPTKPYAGEPVFVAVPVDEPESASGIQSVMLYYYLNEDFYRLNWINMTYTNGMWQGVIPGQSAGTEIKFFILAYDRARNLQQTPTHYTIVVGGGNSLPGWLPLMLIAGAVTVVAVGSMIYVIRSRRAKVKSSKQK